LLASLTATQAVQRFNLVLRDQVPITLYIVQPNALASAYVQQEAPSGFTAKLSVKVAPTATNAASLASDALAFCGTWTLSGSGATAAYAGTLDLNVQGLIAAVGTSPYLDCLLELVLQDVNGTNRDSTQVALRIKPDVHRVTDAPPASLAPWWQEYTNANGAKCLRITNSAGETLLQLAPPGETP
jgi:hypothetical protein